MVQAKQEAYGYAEVFLPTEASSKLAAAAVVNGAVMTSSAAATPVKSDHLLKTPVTSAKKANRLNIRSRSPSPNVATTTPSAPG